MQIVYPYNENLPTQKAHDVYLFQNCASLSRLNYNVHLLIGEGSLPNEELVCHYQAEGPTIHRLPILRGRKFPQTNSNRPFHQHSQKVIEGLRPDVVITSVRKQGIYHIRRRVSGVQYVFEVHQIERAHTRRFREERKMLAAVDLIVVTTQALANILRTPPYSLKTRIEVIPLATTTRPLSSWQPRERLQAAYIGQLYPMQGVDLLIEALKETPDIHLRVIGGSCEQIAALNQHLPNVTFCGFQPPSKIPDLLEDVDLFLMPSRNLLDKPHVAHTKLIEYANLRRPIVAPNLPPVQEHLGTLKGVATYEPANAVSLAETLRTLSIEQLNEEVEKEKRAFTWERRSQAYATILEQLVSPHQG